MSCKQLNSLWHCGFWEPAMLWMGLQENHYVKRLVPKVAVMRVFVDLWEVMSCGHSLDQWRYILQKNGGILVCFLNLVPRSWCEWFVSVDCFLPLSSQPLPWVKKCLPNLVFQPSVVRDMDLLSLLVHCFQYFVLVTESCLTQPHFIDWRNKNLKEELAHYKVFHESLEEDPGPLVQFSALQHFTFWLYKSYVREGICLERRKGRASVCSILSTRWEIQDDRHSWKDTIIKEIRNAGSSPFKFNPNLSQ